MMKIGSLIMCFLLFTGAATENLAGRLAQFDYGSKEKVQAYLESLKKTTVDAKEALIDELYFPFSIYENGQHAVTFHSKDSARNAFHLIFTTNVLNAIKKQAVDDLLVNYQGIMIGDGQIWITPDNTENGYSILAVNP